MTRLTMVQTDLATPVFDTEIEYLDALEKSLARARHSDFDQHIIRTDDGCC